MTPDKKFPRTLTTVRCLAVVSVNEDGIQALKTLSYLKNFPVYGEDRPAAAMEALMGSDDLRLVPATVAWDSGDAISAKDLAALALPALLNSSKES